MMEKKYLSWATNVKYFLLFGKFEDDEGSFSVQRPWSRNLNCYYPNVKLFKNKPMVIIDDCYKERAISDFLKVGIGKLVSQKVQNVFLAFNFKGIQFVPVIVENNKKIYEYAFMNTISHYDILDVNASEADDYSDTLGGYTNVFDEIIDKEKFQNTKIEQDVYTLSNFKDPYYVNENVKNALEAVGVTGIKFIPMKFSS